MNSNDGTSNIPAITPVAEELSKLKTLAEIREKWTPSTGTAVTFPTLPVTGLFGLGKVTAPRRRTALPKKRALTPKK